MSFAPRPSSFMLVRERRAEGGRPRSAPRAACAAPALHPGRRTQALDGRASPHLLRARGRRSLRPALRGSTGQRGRTGVTMRPRARPGLPPLPAVRARGGRRRLHTARSRWRTRWTGLLPEPRAPARIPRVPPRARLVHGVTSRGCSGAGRASTPLRAPARRARCRASSTRAGPRRRLPRAQPCEPRHPQTNTRRQR